MVKLLLDKIHSFIDSCALALEFFELNETLPVAVDPSYSVAANATASASTDMAARDFFSVTHVATDGIALRFARPLATSDAAPISSTVYLLAVERPATWHEKLGSFTLSGDVTRQSHYDVRMSPREWPHESMLAMSFNLERRAAALLASSASMSATALTSSSASILYGLADSLDCPRTPLARLLHKIFTAHAIVEPVMDVVETVHKEERASPFYFGVDAAASGPLICLSACSDSRIRIARRGDLGFFEVRFLHSKFATCSTGSALASTVVPDREVAPAVANRVWRWGQKTMTSLLKRVKFDKNFLGSLQAGQHPGEPVLRFRTTAPPTSRPYLMVSYFESRVVASPYDPYRLDNFANMYSLPNHVQRALQLLIFMEMSSDRQVRLVQGSKGTTESSPSDGSLLPSGSGQNGLAPTNGVGSGSAVDNYPPSSSSFEPSLDTTSAVSTGNGEPESTKMASSEWTVSPLDAARHNMGSPPLDPGMGSGAGEKVSDGQYANSMSISPANAPPNFADLRQSSRGSAGDSSLDLLGGLTHSTTPSPVSAVMGAMSTPQSSTISPPEASSSMAPMELDQSSASQGSQLSVKICFGFHRRGAISYEQTASGDELLLLSLRFNEPSQSVYVFCPLALNLTHRTAWLWARSITGATANAPPPAGGVQNRVFRALPLDPSLTAPSSEQFVGQCVLALRSLSFPALVAKLAQAASEPPVIRTDQLNA
jgi:hypothetical protein